MDLRKEKKLSRGYRLKTSTHKLIKNLQEITGSDTDTILTKSCLLFYKKIIEEKEKNWINKSFNKI